MTTRIRLLNRLQSTLKWTILRRHMTASILLLTAIPLVVYAASGELNVFVPNTPISSAKVNENFVMLDERIGVYEDAISVDGTTGNVGVGTTANARSLAIEGNIGLYNDTIDSLLLSNTGNDAVIRAQSGMLRFGTNSVSDRVVIDTSGNVGIGTTSPAARLDIRDADTLNSYMDNLQIGNGAATYGYKFRHFGGSSTSTDRLELTDHGNSTIMTWRPDGNVGIGTTGPSDALEVFRSGSDASLALTAGGTQRWQLFSKAGTGNFDLVQQGIGARLSVTNGGFVGIGTTTPGRLLELAPTAGDAYFQLTRPSTTVQSTLGFKTGATNDWLIRTVTNSDLNIYSYGTASNVLTILKASGNVGIGTTSPTQKLHVIGNVTADDYLSNSDARLKRDITPLENAADGIHCLQGVSYRWEDPNASQALQIGLIAQDVEACYPEVVTTDAKGFKSVSYARLVAPLIEVVKGQQQQISSLEARLARLEARVGERK